MTSPLQPLTSIKVKLGLLVTASVVVAALVGVLASSSGVPALLAEVWDWPDASGTRTVDSHVRALRAKVGPDRVRTVHGVGYALEPVSEPVGEEP